MDSHDKVVKVVCLQSPQDSQNNTNNTNNKNQKETKVEFKVPKKAILLSKTIKHMIQDIPQEDDEIPIKNIRPEIMEKVIDYCKFHSEEHTEREKESWNEDFFKSLSKEVLFECISAANFLCIESLLESGCKKIADSIRGKSVQEMREYFGTKNDFTPEEEEKIMKENEWLMDD
jgi:S-phase kinase-associated protein 1